MRLDAQIPPESNIEEVWTTHREHLRLVGPRNRPRYRIIVVGTGLAGASAASSLAAMGYQVDCFCFQDSPRRAHSIAAQGGINAAKDYRNDGDSIYRLFYDTQKGETFARGKPMFGGWPKSVRKSLIKLSLRVFLLPESTGACLPIGRLAVYSSSVPFTAVVKPDSSCCWVLALHWLSKLMQATFVCIHERNC